MAAGLGGFTSPSARFEGWRTRLNDNFGTLGYLIVGLLALSCVVSSAVYKWRRVDELELTVCGYVSY